MSNLVNGLFDFFIGVFNILTTPLQLLINNYFPDMNEFASNAVTLFGSINSNWIPWIKDLLFIPQWCLNLVLAYYIFKLTASFVGNIYTLVIRYWANLVP